MPVPSLLQIPAQIASGLLAEPSAGVAGMYGLLAGDADGGAARVAKTRKKLRYTATDPRAQRVLSDVGQMLAPLGVMDAQVRAPFQQTAGALADAGHPMAATAVNIVPDVAMSFLGGRGAALKQPEMAAAARRVATRTAELPAMGSARGQLGAIGVADRPAFKPLDSETWDDGTVIHFGESPFPQLSRRVQMPTGRDIAAAKVEEVPLDGLHATQQRITKNGMDKPRDDSYGLPIVVESNGIRYIQDGHHRLSADLFAGKKSAAVRLIRKDQE